VVKNNYEHIDFSNLTVLITGGAGFIGSHLADTLLKLGIKKVVVLDDLSTGFKKNIEHLISNPHFQFIEASITDLNACHQACLGVDIVLHHAALGSVPRSIENPMNTDLVNVHGFVNMLYAAKEAGVKRFIFASSSSVYGDDTTFPKTEAKTGNLLSPYAVSKHANEKYAAVFSSLYGMETIGFRYFNVFGERQNPNGPYAAVIPKFIDSLIKNESPGIYGDGTNTRDFTYVGNVVHANLLALSATLQQKHYIMNVACGGTISVNSLFTQINLLLNKPTIKPTYLPPRKGEIKDSFADISLVESILHYQPLHSVEEGLKQTVDWFLTK
jgi:UDP-N-acetylglucosamine/UDP-N-acetylgalactosamine 4-epimerase